MFSCYTWDITGASAVALGAIGAHGLSRKTEKQRDTWKTASHYQLLHSAVLLSIPALTQNPRSMIICGGLFTFGILAFSGGCYMYVLTEEPKYQKIAPYGGTSLILGWLGCAVLLL